MRSSRSPSRVSSTPEPDSFHRYLSSTARRASLMLGRSSPNVPLDGSQPQTEQASDVFETNNDMERANSSAEMRICEDLLKCLTKKVTRPNVARSGERRGRAHFERSRLS